MFETLKNLSSSYAANHNSTGSIVAYAMKMVPTSVTMIGQFCDTNIVTDRSIKSIKGGNIDLSKDNC